MNLPSEPGKPATLRDLLLGNLVSKYSLEEIQDLCFRLDIDAENLPGNTKDAKARELIVFLERRDRLGELVLLGQATRPMLMWTLQVEAGSGDKVVSPLHEQITEKDPAPKKVGNHETPVQIPATSETQSPRLEKLRKIPMWSVAAGVIAVILGTAGAAPVLYRIIANTQLPVTTTIPEELKAKQTTPPTISALAGSTCMVTPRILSPLELSTTVTISGTTFVMGGSDSTRPREMPAHPVTLDSYRLDRYEVTNLQYQEFLRKTNRAAPQSWINGEFPPGEAYKPVVNITWLDANTYCESTGKRLPTEAEWEFACRGPDESLYPWGNRWSDANANTSEAACEQVVQVGSYSPNGDSVFGIHDLVGNAAEWVSSIYMSYPYTVSGAESSTDSVKDRVIRGGSWGDKHDLTTCLARSHAPPASFSSDLIGFRCARSVAGR